MGGVPGAEGLHLLHLLHLLHRVLKEGSEGWSSSAGADEDQNLTSSAQLQPRSGPPAGSRLEAGDGDVASWGLLGWWGGALSMAFRLPWVPLLGAGVRPSRSGTHTGESGVEPPPSGVQTRPGASRSRAGSKIRSRVRVRSDPGCDQGQTRDRSWTSGPHTLVPVAMTTDGASPHMTL